MNVHPATDLASVESNLIQYAGVIRANLAQDGTYSESEPLGVGLWLSEPVVADLQIPQNLDRLKSTLQSQNLEPFTFNGFPQHNFHQAVVKHEVYKPTWWQSERCEYTMKLADIMASLLPENTTGSISTLPIAWGEPMLTDDQLHAAAKNLHKVALHLNRIYETQGRTIVVAIEPEPGCALGDCSSMRQFFMRYLLKGDNADIARRHLSVCHDVCHAAVMREDQQQQIQAYRDCGIKIGKVQVSSAIHVDWDLMSEQERGEAFDQVKSFAEDRYLHQTTMRNGPVGSVRFVEDLRELVLGITAPERLVGNWTIHFHVPIFIETFGKLQTTQWAIPEVLTALTTLPSTPCSNGKMAEAVEYLRPMQQNELENFFTGHFEIETYAWSVLPQQFRAKGLVQDIVQEFKYLKPQLMFERQVSSVA